MNPRLMAESVHTFRFQTAADPQFSIWAPAIGENGRITLPGMSSGLAISAYETLLGLYENIVLADRRLQSIRTRLMLAPNVDADTSESITPLDASRRMPNLYYKREDLTITRAYKVRGAVNGMAELMEQGTRRFIAVSTGNHALGILKAAEILQPDSVRLVIPRNTSPEKSEKIRATIASLCSQGLEASLLEQGESFDAAQAWVQANAGDDRIIAPYNSPAVVAGQGTIGMELVRQLIPVLEAKRPREVVIVAPVGGGGLLGGIATAVKFSAAWHPAFKNLRVRHLGLRLESLTSQYGDAIRVEELGAQNQILFDLLQIEILRMTDGQMAEGMAYVYRDLDIKVEGASGGTVYPTMYVSQDCPDDERLVVSVLSGGNISDAAFRDALNSAEA